MRIPACPWPRGGDASRGSLGQVSALGSGLGSRATGASATPSQPKRSPRVLAARPARAIVGQRARACHCRAESRSVHRDRSPPPRRPSAADLRRSSRPPPYLPNVCGGFKIPRLGAVDRWFGMGRAATVPGVGARSVAGGGGVPIFLQGSSNGDLLRSGCRFRRSAVGVLRRAPDVPSSQEVLVFKLKVLAAIAAMALAIFAVPAPASGERVRDL